MSRNTLRMTPRPKYLSLFALSFQQAIAYRETTFLSVVAQLVWVIIPYSIWQRIFETSEQVGSFDWQRMQTYILVAYGVNMLLTFRVEVRIISRIRTGEIAIELMRPMDYMKARLAEVIGAGIMDGALSVLIVIGLSFFIHLSVPSSPILWLAFLFSVSLGFLVKFLISYITSLFCFWTLNALGLLWLRGAVTNIFSGALIPLEFLPHTIQVFARLSPFQTVIHAPLSIYFGDVQGFAVLTVLGVQVLWVVVMWLLARLMWYPATRVLVVQGG